ncbi:hypothetical protein ACHWQZ_G010454 [Mnemiopsis leidyi]
MNFLLIAGLLGGSLADIFMTNPKGSNNRLNENSVNRANGARMFDSQNNNKGGYNVGESGVEANNDDHTKQFQIEYYGSGAGAAETSQLVVEWAHQHGCGDNPKSQCNNVIQYMCMNQGADTDYPAGAGTTAKDRKERANYMRDGIDTSRQVFIQGPGRHETNDELHLERIAQAQDALDANKGLHESFISYDMCRHREANNGLFRADQTLNNDRRVNNEAYVSARRTRQNPGGTQRGLECPEERDYYPYWQPTLQGPYDAEYQRTPWIDAAYLGDSSNCRYVKNNSFNTHAKSRCVLPGARDYGKSIHREGCEAEGGNWVAFESYLEVLETVDSEEACNEIAAKNEVNQVVWKPLRSDSDEAKCIVKAPQPFCGKAATTRVNHLGNAQTDPLYSSRFHLRLPHFPSGETKRCVLRVRYNITTGDYDHKNTFADSNGENSPVTNDPTVNILGGDDNLGLTLAINTAQFGRTFQDRSHIFKIVPRTAAMAGKFLHNLNVRGQRGNIVQNFPSVEYDFIPDQLTAKKGDLIHVQWAGYNTNPANRAGEGTDATDRNNFVQMAGDLDTSYPDRIEKSSFWQNVESLTAPDATPKDIAVAMASSGYYCGYEPHSTCPAELSLTGNTREGLQGQLNNANASYRGHVLQVKEVGTYFYMCTRNNNFTNRSQKGSIVVKE